MRTVISFILIVFCATVAKGQDREIKMPNNPQKTNTTANIAEQDAGYWCALETQIGTTAMINMQNTTMLGLSFTNGYRFNQYLKVGAGIGGLYYANNDNIRKNDNPLSMPLFLDFRGNILDDGIRISVPYWSMDIGSVVGDAFFMTPTIGLRIGEKRSAWLLGISYSYRNLNVYSAGKNGYHSVFARIGYEF